MSLQPIVRDLAAIAALYLTIDMADRYLSEPNKPVGPELLERAYAHVAYPALAQVASRAFSLYSNQNTEQGKTKGISWNLVILSICGYAAVALSNETAPRDLATPVTLLLLAKPVSDLFALIGRLAHRSFTPARPVTGLFLAPAENPLEDRTAAGSAPATPIRQSERIKNLKTPPSTGSTGRRGRREGTPLAKAALAYDQTLGVSAPAGSESSSDDS